VDQVDDQILVEVLYPLHVLYSVHVQEPLNQRLQHQVLPIKHHHRLRQCQDRQFPVNSIRGV
jgi:hypothetical protein